MERNNYQQNFEHYYKTWRCKNCQS